MTQNHDLVRERQAMLAGMMPTLKDGTYIFCSSADAAIITAASPFSLAVFREDEGTALILREADALRFGFDVELPMSRIVLEVFSALDGIGLTAGVATALAEQGIPCNMIAAYHHDNVFVPASMRHRAIAVLEQVQRSAAEPPGKTMRPPRCP